MPLISRVTRLFTADINAVLDRIEEPEVLLHQAIRDMEAELASLQERLKRSAIEIEKGGEQQQSIEQRLVEADDELDICFAAGEEQLARSLIKRKLELARRLNHVSAMRDQAQKNHRRLALACDEGQEKLSAMREKQSLYKHNNDAEPCAGSQDITIGADEIEVAFLREKQRRVQS